MHLLNKRLPHKEHARAPKAHQKACYSEIDPVIAQLDQDQKLNQNKLRENPNHLHPKRNDLRETASHDELQRDNEQNNGAQSDRQSL